ncbi:Acetyl-coenzyme A carboxylase carboxyl transferase subunit beta [bacterium HR39]|nr:Acetyl-coenzyme A carboxylase carboxyl transferase subunit beta [bacterium HR39]
MNWITNYVRPRLRALVERRRAEIPADLWHQCPACERMIFHRDLDANRRVCPHCDHHFRVGPEFRFRALFGDSWEELELPATPDDPLRFRDLERYADRLKKARAKTGVRDALRAAAGTIGRAPAVVAVMDFAFMGGSMGTAVGEGIVAAAREAVHRRAAFVVFTASGGARMQEGVLSLMQMARTTAAVREVKEAGLPYVVVLTDPTTGGVSASFAMLGDVHIAEPGATIGFAGRRVIEQTIREKLPEGFQTAEYLLEHGMVDMVVHRFELPRVLARLLDLLMFPHARAEGAEEEPARTAPALPPPAPEQDLDALREAADD